MTHHFGSLEELHNKIGLHSGMTRQQALHTAARWLCESHALSFDDAMRDARLLLLDALAISHVTLIAEGDGPLSSEDLYRFTIHLFRRARHEPVSRILGTRHFYGRPFLITPSVLDPRPETEHLVEVALKACTLLPDTLRAAPNILDIGTGSGAIAVSLLAEIPMARALALDISEGALEIAMRNACRHGVAQRLVCRRSDWLSALNPEERFALIVSNPPYVVQKDLDKLMPEVRLHDPHIALDGGPDGLCAYRALAAAAAHLEPGGFLIVEIGVGQEHAVRAILEKTGLSEHPNLPAVHADLAGIPRIVCLSRLTKAQGSGQIR